MQHNFILFSCDNAVCENTLNLNNDLADRRRSLMNRLREHGWLQLSSGSISSLIRMPTGHYCRECSDRILAAVNQFVERMNDTFGETHRVELATWLQDDVQPPAPTPIQPWELNGVDPREQRVEAGPLDELDIPEEGWDGDDEF